MCGFVGALVIGPRVGVFENKLTIDQTRALRNSKTLEINDNLITQI